MHSAHMQPTPTSSSFLDSLLFAFIRVHSRLQNTTIRSPQKIPKLFLALPKFSVFTESMKVADDKLKQSRDEFIAQWGAMGTQWGINRTMAQVHALLMISIQPMCTDDVMEELAISRGNAHTNLKELVSWGLLRMIVVKGDRRDFYEAEKDVWKMFIIITRERKRREIDPALTLLAKCEEDTKGLKSEEAKAFQKQVKELREFMVFASSLSDKVASMKHGFALQMAAKLFG